MTQPAKVEHTHIPGGYGGSTSYVITGSLDAVTAAVEQIKQRWPSAGYGTWFNWPPGKLSPKGEPIKHKAPVEIEPGVWRALGDHSNSCE